MNPLLLLGLRWLGGATMVLAVLGYTYHLGASNARGECDAAAVRAELAAARRDLAQAEKARDDADKRGKQMADLADKNQENADALARDLDAERAARAAEPPPAPPVAVNGKCPAPPPLPDGRMSDRDVGRLRSIRGR